MQDIWRRRQGRLPYGLAGAVVAELLLREAVAATDRGLLAVTGRLTGDERRAARSRAAAISDDDLVGTAVSAAIQARADAVAGATAAVVASTTPTTS